MYKDVNMINVKLSLPQGIPIKLQTMRRKMCLENLKKNVVIGL